MDTEDAIIDNGGEREVIEDVGAVSPYIERAVLSQAFIIKSVDLGNLSALVVSSN